MRSRPWRFLVKLFALGIALEAFGLLGLVFLHVFVNEEVPIRSLLPHPAFSTIASDTVFDPNLGWYPPTDLFGAPRHELPPKEPGEVRVFLLGGSTVYGVGATREDETIARRLQVYLDSEQAKTSPSGSVHVYNVGSPGYISKQELILMITKIIPFEQPDIIIVLDGLNDFIFLSAARPYIDRPYSDVWHPHEVQIAQSIERVMSPVGAITNAVTWTTIGIIRGTFFGNLLDQIVHVSTRSGFGLMGRLLIGRRPEPFSPDPTKLAKAINYYLENIAMMKSICEGANVKFFWFPQPVLGLKQTKTAAEEAVYSGHRDFWQRFTEFYEAAITHDAALRFGKAPFLQDISDSLTLFEGTAYVDPFHYSPAAQDVIARRMAEAILKRP
jgi:lysophospholipase L1-like esterase